MSEKPTPPSRTSAADLADRIEAKGLCSLCDYEPKDKFGVDYTSEDTEEKRLILAALRAYTPSETRSEPIGPATAGHDKMVWDAARYRWLRSGRIDAGVWRGGKELTRMQAASCYCESALDDAIDRAMAGGKL